METIHKHIVLGILAHVDSGKTTLSEAMLYHSGAIRKLGRVDHKDAFLDTDALEKARGITIFSKQALLTAGSTNITLLDTPGHVDFSTETERTLQVLDYAVLVVSGTDGVQSHTETLWRLLRRYHVPTFVFVNKTDLPGKSKEELLAQLNHRLGEGFVDFGMPQADRDEALALCDENLMNRMLEAGQLTDAEIIPAIARRHVFPCWFGSALKLDGVEELLGGLDRFTRPAPALDTFGAKVFKVSQDEQGARLTWLRVTGGELKVKAQLSGEADGEPWAEKANQLRLYSGTKYTLAETIHPGQVCAVTGLTKARQGEGLGAERDSDLPVLEPVLSYQVLLPEGADVHAALGKLHRLEEEEPQLHVVWNETLGEIHVQLMGEIQLEVLRSLLAERFGLNVEFGPGGILYKETITEPMEGVGHYEPLRHYAEGTAAARQRNAVCHRLSGRSAGQKLAAPCADPSGRETAPWRADRSAVDGREDHPHCGPCPPEAHRGRRFPASDLPRCAARPDDGQKPAAGAVVCLPAGSAGGKPWPCHDRYPAHGRQL